MVGAAILCLKCRIWVNPKETSSCDAFCVALGLTNQFCDALTQWSKPYCDMETKMIDRTEASRCLAKAIAYKQCGKDADALAWARKLVEALECADILKA